MSALLSSARAACKQSAQSATTVGRTLAPVAARTAGVVRTGQALPSASLNRRAALGLGTVGFLCTAAGSVRTPVALASSKRAEMESVLDDPQFPPKWPYGKQELARYDESPDAIFYDSPRFVTHIDDAAIGALTKYYADVFPPSGGKDTAILDICSSWISHYPKGYTAGKISGLGMNEAELKKNGVLTDFAVADLNRDPKLPYPDNTFDVVTNAVSVDYLTKPLEVMKEVNRVLKPGGVALMSFSNRCFPTKAIAIWTSTGDGDHIWIVGSYFHYAGGFTKPAAKDISPNPGKSDPMYVVFARKEA